MNRTTSLQDRGMLKTVDRGRLTQVGWALKRLGIEHVAAYSPQARGRSERMFNPGRAA